MASSIINHSISTMGDASGPAQATPPGARAAPGSVGLLQSFKDWWFASSLTRPTVKTQVHQDALAQVRLVEYELYKAILSDDIALVRPGDQFNDRKGRIVAEYIDTQIGDDFIHEFYLENNTAPGPERHVVIIHGYMAAAGYFVKNVEQLIKSLPGLRIHVIDLPGFGNSSRSKFPPELLVNHKDKVHQIHQVLSVENWFIEKLEAWRAARAIDKFDIIAHSMGAYLAFCYLMKTDSDRVDRFITVSPMGTESSYISLINEKKLQYNHHTGGDPLEELITRQNDRHEIVDDDELIKLWVKLGRPKFPKNIILQKLWEWKISPFQLLQLSGPFYSKLLSYWSFQRFRNLKANHSTDASVDVDLVMKLHNYSFSIFNQFQGSGELAITKLINHEILARLPLCDRGLVDFLTEKKIKTLWVYGDKDWMNFKGGQHIFERLEKKMDAHKFTMIANAGHHIYLDNPAEFNRTCIEFLDLAGV